MNEFSGELKGLFEEYRRQHPDPEAGADFMPKLWTKIEARRSTVRFTWRLTQAFVSLALALSVSFAIFLVRQGGDLLKIGDGAYADIVADDHTRAEVRYAAAAIVNKPAPPVSFEEQF